MALNVSRYLLSAVTAMTLSVSASTTVLADNLPDLYFVDAHSQMPKGLDLDKIVPLMDQAALWRQALSDLTPEVAHALAHGNAERLWNLPLK